MPITTEPSPNPPPVGTARVRWSGAYPGGSWGTGCWLLTTGTPAHSDVTTLATDLLGVFHDTFLNLLNADVELIECQVEMFTGGGNIVAAAFDSFNGASVGNPLSAQAAIVISWMIEDVYRGGKPRNYLPFTSQNQLDTPRTYGSTFVADATTRAADFLDAVNALTTPNIDTVTAGVVRFFSGGVALAPPVFSPYLAGSCQPRVCTQRRRLGREI